MLRPTLALAMVVGAVGCVLLASCVGDDPATTTSSDGGPLVDAAVPVEGGPGVDSSSSSSCASPKVECTKGSATVCTDTSSDDQNCGKCNGACGTGATCKSSACVCTDTTQTRCGDLCVDTKTNPAHCGGCGKVCPNDRCTLGECDRFVFVTSTSYNGSLGGVSGADALCQARAAAGNLPGTYQAWISAGVGPSGRFMKKSATPYVLPDGTTKVAESFAHLGDAGGLVHSINMTELKATVASNASVMTNTQTNGDNDSASFDCGGWTSNDVANKFFPGTATASDAATWSTNSGSSLTCNVLNYRLYCFQQ